MVGELQDKNYNGELVQVGPEGSTGSGSVAGVCLYREGLIVLTGSWDLDSNSIETDDGAGPSKWIHFNYGANDGNIINTTTVSASFAMDYKGTTQTQTLTMFAHAPYGELNHSNNPTFYDSSETQVVETDQYNLESPKKIKTLYTPNFLMKIRDSQKQLIFQKLRFTMKTRILLV